MWGTPSICLGPTGNIQGTCNFLSLVFGLVIKHQECDELPAPQSVIDHISSLAKVSGVSKNLVFADHYRIPFNWPNNEFPLLDPRPIGAYPDIPAKMLGVLVDCSTRGVSHPVSPPWQTFLLTMNLIGPLWQMRPCRMLTLTQLLNSLLPQRLLNLMMMMTLCPPLYLPPYIVLYNIFPR
jgi:hypothetical protein